MSAIPYPVHIEGRMDPKLSRWLWLFKWVLILPHAVVLAFLWAAFCVLSLVAFASVALRGRYPRSIFDFNLGVLRWTWRVGFYAYSALGTDRYPPFSLADNAAFPARLDMPYPEHLPRGFALLRWWVIALPHYLIALVFVGAGPVLIGRAADWFAPVQAGVLTLLALMAGVVLLFTGRYPQGLFDLIVGINRWVLRAAAYAALMTDAYPPFRLDTGAAEAGTMTFKPSRTLAPSRGGRMVAVVTGSLVALIGIGLVGTGSGLTIVAATERDGQGFLSTPGETFATSTYALTSGHEELSLEGPDWLHASDILGTVRLRTRSETPVFAGIARTTDVREYLGGVERVAVRDLGAEHRSERRLAGGAPAMVPGDAGIWAASLTGSGRQELRWKPRSGNWTVVLMNADGSRGVRARMTAAARLPHLGSLGAGLAIGGVLLLSGAAALLVVGIRKERQGA
jgi:hypothetical protein